MYSRASHLLLALIACLPLAAVAGVATPSGCDDLGAIPETPAVDFSADIQPIFEDCTGCHGESGQAGLDLRPGQSLDNLVGVTATTNPARQRVAPFDPDASLLLSAVNCDVTGGPSFQMPGTTIEERALIRDWIVQGARAEPEPQARPVPLMGVPAALALVLLLGLIAAGRLNPRSAE